MLEPMHNRLLAESILKALIYSDLFRYPLTMAEIYQRMETNHISQKEVEDELLALNKKKLVFSFSPFYSIRNDPTQYERRVKGNELATKMMHKALRNARLMFHFPFTRAIMISGSLSKNYADEASDVDYFIIVKPGRLWIARTLLTVYKRIFLMNSKKYFCVNYFIDEDHLEIEEKNLFTAVELTTLIPIHGFTLYLSLIDRNPWVLDFFPNFKPKQHSLSQGGKSLVKKIMERILSTPLFDPMETMLMKITLRRWIRIYGAALAEPDFKIAFKTKSYVSKGHLHNYQKKVTESYQQRVREFFNQHAISLDE